MLGSESENDFSIFTMLNEIQQFTRAVSSAKNILIATQGNESGDAIASTSALLQIFEKLGKKVTALSISGVPENLRFLKKTNEIYPELPTSSDFVISLDLSKARVDQLSYKIEDNKLNILVKPEAEGRFKSQDVSAASPTENFDLVITINTRDLERLGALFTNNPNLFYNSLIVNIDHDPANESYGKINLVDVHAASTTQVVYAIAEALEKEGHKVFDKDTATALLSGIIAETESFQTHSVTPEVFRVASALFERKADQQEIIRYLFRTKSLASLNLWGRVLARLKQDDSHKIAWSVLKQEDFRESQAQPSDLESALKELLGSVPGSEVLFVLYEQDTKIFGKVHTPKNRNALELAQMFPRASGNREMAQFEIIQAPSLEAAENLVLTNVKQKIS